MRKRGHGGVLEAVRALIKGLNTKEYDHACFVILLDRKTLAVQKQIRKLIQGKPRFVLGVAIEEIEAWWLGDRTNTLAWSGLGSGKLPQDCEYAKPSYKAETDKKPKATLDKLTRLSHRFDRFYGDGNLDMAQEFAEDYWQDFAKLNEISSQCPRGYGGFQRSMTNALQRVKVATRRLF